MKFSAIFAASALFIGILAAPAAEVEAAEVEAADVGTQACATDCSIGNPACAAKCACGSAYLNCAASRVRKCVFPQSSPIFQTEARVETIGCYFIWAPPKSFPVTVSCE